MAQPSAEWPRVLILDANVYLNLAKIPGNAKVFKAIESAVRRNDPFDLVIPEPVISAIQLNRQNAIEQHWKIRQDALQRTKNYLADLATDREAFDRQLTELEAAITKSKAGLPDTVAAMDALVAVGKVERCADHHYADAGKRFITKKAPAHERPDKKRQHIAIFNDCLIWSIIKNVAQDNFVEFITADTDFTSIKHNEKLHEDLQLELGSLKFKFHTLDDFLDKHISKSIKAIHAPAFLGDELWPSFKLCPACGSDKIRPDLIPGPTAAGWGYRQFCPAHMGYVATGEPYDD